MNRARALAAAALGLALATPAHADPGDGFVVEWYRVELEPDLATGAVAARQGIMLEVTDDGLDRLEFSPNALTISAATIDGRPIAATSSDDGIAFIPDKPLAAGASLLLKFEYSGTPNRGTTLVEGGMYTGYFACDWMVCLQDRPGAKAPFVLEMVVPQGTATLGPGKLVLTTPLDGWRDRVTWSSAAPMSPYLFAFVAGNFTGASEDPAIRVLTAEPGVAVPPGHVETTEAMAAFFADKAGFDLPTGSYTQLLVPGTAAQESAGFSAIGAEWLAREENDPQSAWVVAHELAHEWWGNSVTSETWRDFWLNEGFATFMVAAWKEHRFGREAYDAEIENLRVRRAQLAERGWDKPLTWTGDYPSLAYRRAVQYSKGALFLAILRAELGDDAFWQGVRTYTTAHAGGTVVSADFQRAMERASGRDLSPLFAEWVYGKPEAS